MMVLEILVWLSLGAAMALAKLTFGSLESPKDDAWAPTLATAAIAALIGGGIGLLAMRGSEGLGDFNSASIVLAGTGAAVALLVRGAARDHRSIRRPPGA
jgi:hypothetical protein